MALFAFWQEHAGLPPPDRLRDMLLEDAHVVPERIVSERRSTPLGSWRFLVLLTGTHFYGAEDQLWLDPDAGDVCVIHGLLWREDGGRPHLLDARAVAAWLDRPGRTLPADIAGEYAVVRLYACGTLEMFGDAAGLHHLFHSAGPPFAVANRASLVATIRQDRTSDVETLRWLPTIGYRVGCGTAYRGVAALGQGAHLSVSGEVSSTTAPTFRFDRERGFGSAEHELLARGIVQAQAAILLAADGSDAIDLPITGGKDSRVVLALCLSLGLSPRLRLFTRGYEGHPDVVAGRRIAAVCNLPHRREAPHGSDLPALWTAETFLDNLAAQTFQTDGMMGGWDYLVGNRLSRETLITGHMGEVLKAYSKRPLPEGALDPVALVRLQAPFDPLGLLKPHAEAEMREEISAQIAHALEAGAMRGDLPDLFYFRNRVPNWLGGIRSIKSFERQPVMPLGVPALMELAFLLTPEERKTELVHALIVRQTAPELLAPPFAMQRWDERLREQIPDIAMPDPVVPAASAPPTFGNWQYSLNHNPRIREMLRSIFLAQDLGLWSSIDRDAVLERLRTRSFDYFDGISLLGLTVAVFQEAGIVRRQRLALFDDARSVAPPLPAPSGTPTVHGHLDAVRGPVVALGDSRYRMTGDGTLTFDGWVRAPDFPGASVAITARVDGRTIATANADRPRPDLQRAGLEDGRHGFALSLEASALEVADAETVTITLSSFDGGFVPIGGQVTITS